MTEKLPAEELEKMWKDYKVNGDLKVREQLIEYYLFLVKHVAGRLIVGLPSHLKIEDLYSTGVIGLIKAVERYDPSMQNKFETYAVLLIRGAIIDEMRSLDWVPRSVHQKANMIAQAQHGLEQELGREPTDAELAKKLNMSIADLQQLMERVRPAVMVCLDKEASASDERVHISERIPDQKMKTSFEQADRNEFSHLLREAVMDLPEQERTVLVLYYYENLMLKDIGKIMGVSESRVSQIHTKSMMRLRRRLKKFAEEFSNML